MAALPSLPSRRQVLDYCRLRRWAQLGPKYFQVYLSCLAELAIPHLSTQPTLQWGW